MINVLHFFSWTTWLIFLLIIIFIFWIVYGGKGEYEFVGIKPLKTPDVNEIPEDFDVKMYEDVMSDNEEEEEEDVPPLFDPHKMNKGEDIVAEAFESLVNAPVYRNLRPAFLKNPETKQNLELDCYCPKYNIAVEYNGEQHYKFPSSYHKTKEQFINQVYRDRLKRKLCDQNGVYLISVPYWVDMFENYDDHLTKQISYKNKVSRSIRYQKIYNYLYQKISEYFEIILSQKQNDYNQSYFN